MATFFCNMTVKTGTSGATASSHFSYIAREKQYAKRGQELVGCGQGNLPDFCEGNPRKFFQACEENDVRSHRSITFALPNELPPEAWQEIINEYVKEVCPELPYFYAIHQVDSAVYGERNPHCHLMFSERVVDARTKGMTETEFFSKHGKTIHGREYGGSVKTRMYAGKSSTQKIYEIREKLAEITNQKYADYHRPERISAKTLKKQREEQAKRDDGRELMPERLEIPRLDRATFFVYKEEMSQAVRENLPVSEMNVPDEVKERILYEQERKLVKEINSLLDEYKQEMAKQAEEEKEAQRRAQAKAEEEKFIQGIVTYAKKGIEPSGGSQGFLLGTPDKPTFKIYENGVMEDVQGYRYHLSEVAKYQDGKLTINGLTWKPHSPELIHKAWTADLNRVAREEQERQVIRTKSVHSAVAIMIEERKAIQEEFTTPFKKESVLFELTKLNQGMEDGDPKLIAEAKKEIHKNEIRSIQEAQELPALIADASRTMERIEQELMMTDDDQRKQRLIYIKDALNQVIVPARELAIEQELMQAQQLQDMESRVAKKHERWLSEFDQRAAKQIDHLVQDYVKAHQPIDQRKTKDKIKDDIVNELTHGKLKELQEQLRSQKSFLKYHEEKTGDQAKAIECRREIARLERAITDMRIKYGGTIPVMREIDRRYDTAKNNYEAQAEKTKAHVKHKLQMLSKKQKVSQAIRNKAAATLTKLFTIAPSRASAGRSDHGLAADRVRTEEENTIGRGGNMM